MRTYTDEEVNGVLHYDSLSEAEQVTKQSYKDNSDTTLLGMNLMMRNGDAKERMLRANGDVTNRMKLPEYVAVIERNGFKQVGEWQFMSFLESRPDEKRSESLFAYFRHPGQLLVFDTYFGRVSVNSGHIYYNVRPKQQIDKERLNWPYGITSSGHWATMSGGRGRDEWERARRCIRTNHQKTNLWFPYQLNRLFWTPSKWMRFVQTDIHDAYFPLLNGFTKPVQKLQCR